MSAPQVIKNLDKIHHPVFAAAYESQMAVELAAKSVFFALGT
jgi:hypothetical protein